MPPFVQGSQRQRADLELPEPFAHLSQAYGDASQALDLNVYVITDALIRLNQPAKIDSHATSALAAYTRHLKRYLTPDRHEGLPRTKSVPTEASTSSRPAAPAFAFSEKALRHFCASNAMAMTHYVAHDRHKQRSKSCTYCLAQALHRLVQLCFKQGPSIDRCASLGYSCHRADSLFWVLSQTHHTRSPLFYQFSTDRYTLSANALP